MTDNKEVTLSGGLIVRRENSSCYRIIDASGDPWIEHLNSTLALCANWADVDAVRSLTSSSVSAEEGKVVAKHLADRAVQSLADSIPTDRAIEAMDLLRGTPVESMFCVDADELSRHIETVIADALYDRELYASQPPRELPTPEVQRDDCYGLTLAELKERIDAIHRGEGIPHTEAVARIRAALQSPSLSPSSPNRSELVSRLEGVFDRLDQHIIDMRCGEAEQDLRSLGHFVKELRSDAIDALQKGEK